MPTIAFKTTPTSLEQLRNQIYTIGNHLPQPAVKRWAAGATKFVGEHMTQMESIQKLVSALDQQLTAAKQDRDRAETALKTAQPLTLDNETMTLMESVAKKHGVSITLLPATGASLSNDPTGKVTTPA